MDERLLLLKPIRYFCPMCGEWHEWKSSQNLLHHAKLKCEKYKDILHIHYLNDSLYVMTETVCGYSNIEAVGLLFMGSIKIEDIYKSPNEQKISFILPINEEENQKPKECSDCSDTNKCFIYRVAKDSNKLLYVMLGFEFKRSDYEEIIGWRLFTDAKRDGDKEGHPDGKQ